jgi:hypothetical protein
MNILKNQENYKLFNLKLEAPEPTFNNMKYLIQTNKDQLKHIQKHWTLKKMNILDPTLFISCKFYCY